MFHEGVFEAEEVEHAVESYGRQALFGRLLDFGLGVEGYAETGCGEHGQVVGSVAHRYGLGYVHVFHLCEQPQEFGLAPSVHDVAEVSPVSLPSCTSRSLA